MSTIRPSKRLRDARDAERRAAAAFQRVQEEYLELSDLERRAAAQLKVAIVALALGCWLAGVLVGFWLWG